MQIKMQNPEDFSIGSRIYFINFFESVRVARIELASQPWEGRILPLNHTRLGLLRENISSFGTFDKYDIIKTLENKLKEIMPNMNQPVTIYTTPSCHFCHMAKEFFKEKNISYTENDVASDVEKRKEMVDKSGQMGVPVIVIGNEIVIGFNKPKISQLLGIS